MPQKSTARATWKGSLATGAGTVSTTSPAIDAAQLAWKARIGEQAGTTPEELLAAAHAGCFAMAFSGALSKDGSEPTQLDVSATYEFGPTAAGFGIHGAVISVEGNVPGVSQDRFLELAEDAKVNCPVSQAMTGIPITLDAKLLAHA